MADFEIRAGDERDREAIAEFVRNHPQGDLDQTWEGSRLSNIASHGLWKVNVCVALSEGRIMGVMPWAIGRLGIAPVRLCRSFGGPLTEGAVSSELTEIMLKWLVERARNERCCRVDVQTICAERVGDETVKDSEVLVSAFASAGFRRSSDSQGGTFWVVLDEDENMLNKFSKKCRRDVRKGLREGVTVVERNQREAVEEFVRYYLAMCNRKSLRQRDEQYIMEGVWPCVSAGLASLFVAVFDGKTRNMAIVTTTGMPRYWLGATAETSDGERVPPTGQVLHFCIMRHLRNLGRKVYDLGGSPGPTPVEGHPNYGVWRFKHEFGGPYVVRLGGFERILSRTRSGIVKSADRLRRLFRGRR